MKQVVAQARPKRLCTLAAAASTGVLAALTVLGVGHLVAAFIDPAASPFYAMGAAVVDHTPHALKDAAIRRFGSNDKLALFISMGAVMVVFAAILGILERRRPLGSVLLVLLGGVVAEAALQRPTATAWFAVPAIAGVIAGVVVMRVLIRQIGVDDHRLGAESAATAESTSDSTRASNGATRASGASTAPHSNDGVRDHQTREPESKARPRSEGGQHSAASAGSTASGGAGARAGRVASGDAAVGGSPGEGASRRRFLAMAAGVGALAAGAAVAGKWIGARLHDVVADRAGFVVPRAAVPARAAGSGVRPSVAGLSEFVTPNDRFYRVDTALQLPALTSGDWRLRIHGMVDRPIELDFDQLRRRTPVERMITMTCVSNEVGGDLAGTAVWTGYPLADLLAEVGVRPEADMLLSRSIDGFTAGTPVSAVTDGRDALLAIGMNGEPLPIAHGYPARLIVPGLYGYVSATKWVVDLELTRFDRAKAYWTERGWGAQAPIKTASRIDVPAAFATIPAGEVVVAGVAWAQHRGIDAVEVQVDNQPWQPATLADEYSTDTWRQWTWRWTAAPGPHTLRVRATDRTGAPQTDARTPPFPDGSTGWHSRVITVS